MIICTLFISLGKFGDKNSTKFIKYRLCRVFIYLLLFLGCSNGNVLAQTFSVDNPNVHVLNSTIVSINYNDTILIEKHEQVNVIKKPTFDKNIHLINGAQIYGLDNIYINEKEQKGNFKTQKRKLLVNNKLLKKKTDNNIYDLKRVNFILLPNKNNESYTLLSDQILLAISNNPVQNFAQYQIVKEYISLVQNYIYIKPSYPYSYTILIKNIIDGGGVRPPPNHC